MMEVGVIYPASSFFQKNLLSLNDLERLGILASVIRVLANHVPNDRSNHTSAARLGGDRR